MWKDLEPNIYRQRLVIEGKSEAVLNSEEISKFLLDLSEKLGMTIVYGPIVKNLAETVNSVHEGYEGVLIWAESGCQLYTWKRFNFFTLDIYTCKRFETSTAVEFTKNVFKASDIVWKEV